MKPYILPLADDSFGQEEKDAMSQVIESGNYTMGAKVEEFESSFAEWVGANHSIMVNSGSSANLLLVYSQLVSSFKEASLLPGDEVLVPALLWPTTVWPLIQFGLKPVLVDIDSQSLGLCLEDARQKITEKTKAIFLIHILGYACDMDKYASFCSTNKLTLMEDCCESFGAFHNQKSVGRFGVGGTFSHFFSHHLTTMEGGTIITDDDELVNDLRSMRAHGWTRNRTDANKISKKFPDLDPRFLFLIPGFNVRPMEIQAAVGLVQLKRINELLDFRMKFAKFIIDVFKPISWIKIVGSNRVSLAQSHVDRSHSWMNIPFTLEDDAPQVVNVIKDIFENHGVETRPIITGNFMMQPAASYLGSQGYFPNAQEISERGFMIGCHAMEVSEDLQATIQNIVKALQNL